MPKNPKPKPVVKGNPAPHGGTRYAPSKKKGK
jgi:hypothetical protein